MLLKKSSSTLKVSSHCRKWVGRQIFLYLLLFFIPVTDLSSPAGKLPQNIFFGEFFSAFWMCLLEEIHSCFVLLLKWRSRKLQNLFHLQLWDFIKHLHSNLDDFVPTTICFLWQVLTILGSSANYHEPTMGCWWIHLHLSFVSSWLVFFRCVILYLVKTVITRCCLVVPSTVFIPPGLGVVTVISFTIHPTFDFVKLLHLKICLMLTPECCLRNMIRHMFIYVV